MCEDQEKVPLDIVTQISCQEACLNRGDNCVGFSCSSIWPNRVYACDKECFICSSQSLVDGENGGDVFIKRPGN